ncbi:MAG: TIGR02652 family protein [Synechococcaceae cyanobacterium SM2_3_1]|nr:TIGR02652 family protein [Synechococcaceae cyanobacterium SM2_3_1]
MTPAFSYPIYGPSIHCPHCQQPIAALTLTDTYLCHRHGAFEANADYQELVHLQSGRRWRQWDGRWFRQHTHVDGIRFEIHEELDKLRNCGMRATQIRVSTRYKTLLMPCLNQGANRRGEDGDQLRLYGLPVVFCTDDKTSTSEQLCRWEVINFELSQEHDPSLRKPSQFQVCE